MKKFLRVLLASALIAALWANSIVFAEEIAETQEDSNVSAMEMAAMMKVGWNLGNSFESYADGVSSETAWNNAATTKEMIMAVKDAGFSTIRIPVTYTGHIDDENGYKVDEALLNRVAEVVDWALEAELYVIINVHHDGNNDLWGGAWLSIEEYPYDNENWQWVDEEVDPKFNQEAIRPKFAALWKQIAERFEGYGDELIFESANELMELWNYGNPASEKTYPNLNELNQIFVDTVRATGGNNADRFLLISGYNTNVWYTAGYVTEGGNRFELPTDTAEDKLFVSVHFYDPYNYTLEEKEDFYKWGKAAIGAADPSALDWHNEESVVDNLANLNRFIDAGVPVIMGEYGNIDKTHFDAVAHEYRRYYLEYVTKAMLETGGIVPVYWDNGWNGEFGFALFDRDEVVQTHPDLINAIVRVVDNDVRPLFGVKMASDFLSFYDESLYTGESWSELKAAYNQALITFRKYELGTESLANAEEAFREMYNAANALVSAE